MNEGHFHQEAKGEGIAQAGPGGIASVTQHIYKIAPPPMIDPAELQAAKQHLSSMPIDEVPPVSELLESSHLPWPANQDFVGRQTDLKQLAGLLKLPFAVVGHILD